MITSSKDIKNIPISISMLHDQEYNIYLVLKSTNQRERKRRAFSDKSNEKTHDRRFQTLKNK